MTSKPARAIGGPGRVSYQQQAYDHVKPRIMDLSLKPGAWLTDASVAAELGVSRTPVREAFRRLESEGLLVSAPRRGWRVHALSIDDIREIFDLKEALETAVVERAATCEDKGLRARLKKALKAMERASGDYPAWQAADVELHDTIFAMYPNGRARRAVEQLNSQWQPVRVGLLAMEGRMERATAEHRVLVERILSHDGRGAARAMARNLQDLRRTLEQILVNVVLPFTGREDG